MINQTNLSYKMKKLALVMKFPTPWKVLFKRGTNIPMKAFVEEKSFLDYIGTTCGRAIAFDAKSTKELTRFPLNNIKPHQVELMGDWERQGGIAFILIYFEKKDEVYFADYEFINKYWTEQENGGRKSIPYEEIKEQCERVKPTIRGIVDYLEVIERREK